MKTRLDNLIPEFLIAPRMRLWRHALLFVMLLLISINILWDTTNELIATPVRLIIWAAYLIVLIGLVYFNMFVLVRRLLLKNRPVAYGFSALGLILFLLVSIGTMQLFMGETERDQEVAQVLPFWLNILSSVITVGLLFAGTSSVYLFRQWLTESTRAADLESTTLRSELNFLKSQINPHFLFNMLNNAYLLVKKRKPEAQEVIFKLEDLLRYQLNESAQETVSLVSDIRFLDDFLQLEKVRRDRFEYSMTTEGDLDGMTVPPLLFIPFVENAVKHNNDSENRSEVHIYFRVGNGRITFRCENTKPPVPALKNEVGGIGLKNIQRRLELLYPGRHTLEIEDEETTYTVKLELK